MGSDKKRFSSRKRKRRSSAKRQRVADSKANEKSAPSSHERKDMISLGQEQLSVKRGSEKPEKVIANDLILESLVHRAIGERKLRDVKELYRLCDAEEASLSTQHNRKPTASQLAQTKLTLGRFASRLSSIRSELLELELVDTEDGTPKVSEKVRRFLREDRGSSS